MDILFHSPLSVVAVIVWWITVTEIWSQSRFVNSFCLGPAQSTIYTRIDTRRHEHFTRVSSNKNFKDEEPSSPPRQQQQSSTTIRLNKVFKATHSRREADRIIQDGRVAINGQVSFGDMVTPFVDEISLDGKLIDGWEAMNGILPTENSESVTTAAGKIDASSTVASPSTDTFEYVKYYKPRGVVCTTDERIRGNIIDALTTKSGYLPKHRVYPVGRLDKDSTGLILITSDGRLPNASLRREQKQSKVYRVRVDRPLQDDDLEELRSGIVITTVAQRDGKSKPLTAKTKPCIVTSLGLREVEIILQEGRNRQIRKMMAALGYDVLKLHRVGFGQISLDRDMKAGDYKVLNTKELQWIESILD